MALCPICGEELVVATVETLKCDHEAKHALGEPKVGSAALECPLKSGAIWVYVTDDAGTGVKGIPVTVTGPKDTDGAGFSSFDPLAAGAYTVKIQVPDALEDQFHPPSKTTVNGVNVLNGQITMLEFKLERIAPLKVIVKHPEDFSGDLGIEAAGDLYKPASKQAGQGFVLFPRLRKDKYTVRFTLSEQQKKKYAIQEAESKPWSHDPYGNNEVTYTVVPLKLLRLEVADAHDLTGGRYWCVKDAVRKVKVKAITEPNDERAWSQLAWASAAPTGTKQDALVDISAVGDVAVKATLDVDREAAIEVYDILKVDWPAAKKKLSATRWKDYASANLARMKVTTEPDLPKVWRHLTWSEGTITPDKNEADVELKPVGDRTVTVTLDTKPVTGDLHICQWPVLEISKVVFDGHKILNDGVKEIGVAFDKQWIKGRKQHTAKATTTSVQSPLCYTRHSQIELTAEFEVTTPPTEDETVSFRAVHPDFGQLTADVKVGSGDTWVTTPAMTSTGTLPDTVKYVAAWTIPWEHTLQDGSFSPAKSSINPLYLTLDDPSMDVYLTLLDISCAAADGKATEDDLVSFSFVPFTTHIDDGNGFPRKGDGLRLSYYKTGVSTAADDTTYTPVGMLGSPEATGRCGGWAALLEHMWMIHGIATSRQRWYVRAVKPELANMNHRFLVKNVDFSKPPDLPGDLYDYDGEETMKLNGVPGQGKKNPQFDFGDHVVVTYGGEIYDPSYGIGPYPDDQTYLGAALDGLGTFDHGTVSFTMVDGTNQFISAACTRYATGFAKYTLGTNFADIASGAGVSAATLLASDPLLAGSCAKPKDVQEGDIIDSPLVPLQIVFAKPTFSEIAAAHGVTMQAIFDDPANATLKTLRVTPDRVTSGDTILVTAASGAADWVIGHDQ